MDTIRNIEAEDIPALKAILGTIELFPPEALDEMLADYLNNPETEAIWMTFVAAGVPLGLLYCAPEHLTNGTYNLYAIGVSKERQGAGIGRQLMQALEKKLSESGARILIVDTSGKEDFALTRKFYQQLGYEKEAVIRDFWDTGDDKVTFRKAL